MDTKISNFEEKLYLNFILLQKFRLKNSYFKRRDIKKLVHF